MHFYYHYHYFLILVIFSKKVLPRGGPLEITKGGRGGGGETFLVHEFFFSSLVCMIFFFWLCMNCSFSHCWQEIFFQTSFPCIIFFLVCGGGGGGRNCLEIAYSPTDLPTYPPDHLPPILIKMNAARFLYESSNLLFPFYSSVT